MSSPNARFYVEVLAKAVEVLGQADPGGDPFKAQEHKLAMEEAEEALLALRKATRRSYGPAGRKVA